jgi:hypothetical protein
MAVGYPKKNHTLEMCNIVRLRKQVFVWNRRIVIYIFSYT